MQRRDILCALAAGAASAATPTVRAQASARPIRIIVPFAPGGPIDQTIRLIAEKSRDALGTIVIENRPGGGGGIGVDLVAKSAPDGHTLGVAAVAMHAITPGCSPSCPTIRSRTLRPSPRWCAFPMCW